MDKRAEFGRGTFGTVFSGINKETKGCVAVKVCNADNKSRLEAALKETEIMNNIMDHPNVVPLGDFWEEEEETPRGKRKTVNIVMPMAKQNLRQYVDKIKEKKALFDRGRGGGNAKEAFNEQTSGKALLELTKMLLRGLLHLHDSNPTVVHRDLKPENVLVFEEEGGANVLKIGDFGISKLLKDKSSTDTDCGTNAFKAPEVKEDWSDYRKEVDVWSLGLVLYFLLTGEDRFKNRDEVLAFEETTPLFRTKRRLFQGEEVAQVEWLIKQMIHPDPKGRIFLEKALRETEMPGKLTYQL